MGFLCKCSTTYIPGLKAFEYHEISEAMRPKPDYISISSSSITAPYSGSRMAISPFYRLLSWTASGLISRARRSSLTLSFHLFLGRPLLLAPSTSNACALLTICSPSLLWTCPYHLSLFSDSLSTTLATLVEPQMYAFRN